MNRRGFLSALIGAGVAAAADPERLLWTPKLISIPKPTPMRDVWLHVDVEVPIGVNELMMSHSNFLREYMRPAVQHLADEIERRTLERANIPTGALLEPGYLRDGQHWVRNKTRQFRRTSYYDPNQNRQYVRLDYMQGDAFMNATQVQNMML